jgi:hypothetical protein
LAGTKADFLPMLEHYGMVLGIHPAKVDLYSAIPSKVEYGDDLRVKNVSDWVTFGIVAQGHSLVIKSFG